MRRRDPCLWLVLTLTGVWSRDDSSEVEAQSIWGVVVGVTASQLSSLGSSTSGCYRGIFKQLDPPLLSPLPMALWPPRPRAAFYLI